MLYKVFTLIEADNYADLQVKLDNKVNVALQSEGTVADIFQVTSEK